MSGADESRLVVIPAATVRVCIDRLQAQQVHQFFPMYLHLRRQAALQQTTQGIAPNLDDLADFLRVPGGPFGKPYLRPFWTGRRAARQEWMNRNLAGSYAPSSLREVPRRVIELTPEGKFSLRDNHWHLAKEHLLENEAIPVRALAGFYLRNYGCMASGTPSSSDLSRSFLELFGYTSWQPNTEEMDTLFDPSWDATTPWFEDFTPPEPAKHEESGE